MFITLNNISSGHAVVLYALYRSVSYASRQTQRRILICSDALSAKQSSGTRTRPPVVVHRPCQVSKCPRRVPGRSYRPGDEASDRSHTTCYLCLNRPLARRASCGMWKQQFRCRWTDFLRVHEEQKCRHDTSLMLRTSPNYVK